MRIALGVLALCALAVQGCLLPEDCELSLLLTREGRYKVRASGTLSYALHMEKELRREPRKTEEFVRSALNGLRRSQGWTKVEPAEGPRFSFAHEHEGTWGEEVSEPCLEGGGLMGLIQLKQDHQGELQVAGPVIKKAQTLENLGELQSGIAHLETLGYRFRATVRVITDMPVLAHNAQAVEPVERDPRYKRYVWNLHGLDGRKVSMRVAAR